MAKGPEHCLLLDLPSVIAFRAEVRLVDSPGVEPFGVRIAIKHVAGEILLVLDPELVTEFYFLSPETDGELAWIADERGIERGKRRVGALW